MPRITEAIVSSAICIATTSLGIGCTAKLDEVGGDRGEHRNREPEANALAQPRLVLAADAVDPRPADRQLTMCPAIMKEK